MTTGLPKEKFKAGDRKEKVGKKDEAPSARSENDPAVSYPSAPLLPPIHRNFHLDIPPPSSRAPASAPRASSLFEKHPAEPSHFHPFSFVTLSHNTRFQRRPRTEPM